MTMTDHTHDPSLRSWVESAQDPTGDFPIQNLPLCVFADSDGREHFGTAIGDRLVSISVLAEAGKLDAALGPAGARGLSAMPAPACAGRLSPGVRGRLRERLSQLLRHDSAELRDDAALRARAVAPASECEPRRPAEFRNYTDFYASIHHATTVGRMFRPDNPLLPNYKHVPIGYHGRASSIVVSGTPVRRPVGQQAPPDGEPHAGPTFGPCKLLDYELELGCVIGPGNALGEPIPVGRARAHIAGYVLVNDWSARDIQKWEYQPLGPFLAKNFATTVSPFIVTPEALAPYACPAMARPDGDPKPLPYLADAEDQAKGGLDLKLRVMLRSAEMARRGIAAVTLSEGSLRDMYWTFAQMIAHHTSNGCNLEAGDLIASGTVSGPTPESRGCLLELTWDGSDSATGKPRPRKPVQLPTGETRTFLADGDTVTFRAQASAPGRRTIGMGECSGTILPSA